MDVTIDNGTTEPNRQHPKCIHFHPPQLVNLHENSYCRPSVTRWTNPGRTPAGCMTTYHYVHSTLIALYADNVCLDTVHVHRSTKSPFRFAHKTHAFLDVTNVNWCPFTRNRSSGVTRSRDERCDSRSSGCRVWSARCTTGTGSPLQRATSAAVSASVYLVFVFIESQNHVTCASSYLTIHMPNVHRGSLGSSFRLTK